MRVRIKESRVDYFPASRERAVTLAIELRVPEENEEEGGLVESILSARIPDHEKMTLLCGYVEEYEAREAWAKYKSGRAEAARKLPGARNKTRRVIDVG